jgi:PAS domain-containing protein
MNENEVSINSGLESEFSLEGASDEGDLSAHSVDLADWFSAGLTETGSFDLGIIAVTSFGSLLDVLPIPVLMIDSTYRVVFVNQACRKVSPDCEQIHGVPFTTLVPRSRNAEKALWLLRKVFASRKPQVADGILEMAARKIWGRLYFSSIRIGRERYVLLVIEDLTGERTKLLLNKRGENYGRKTREGLEKLIAKLSSELSAARQVLAHEMRRHGETQEALASEKQMFQALAEHSTDAVAVIDANDTLRHVSSRFKELFEYPPDATPDLINWFHTLNWPPDADGRTIAEHLETLASEKDSRVVTWRDKGGAEKQIDLRAVRVAGRHLLVICRERHG